MLIRPARPEDLPALLAIYNQAIEETTASWDLVPWTPVQHAGWWAAKAEAGHPVLVADRAGQAIGYATYGPFRPKAGYAATMEHSLYVQPGHQGRGAGKALLAAIIESARTAGVHVLVGGISADNTASLGLHATMGFAEVGRLPQVGRKFDRWLDLVLVQLIL